MKKPLNIKEFIVLRDRYNSITEEECKEFNNPKYVDMADFLRNLTGFGAKKTCTLCKPLLITDYGFCEVNCDNCVWKKFNDIFGLYACNSNLTENTYITITIAKTPKQLLKAFRNRAKLMTKVIKQLNLE